MERRRSARIDLLLGVDLSVGTWTLGHFLTGNLSCDGLFLETGPFDFRPGDSLTLAARLNGRPHRLDVVVVRRSEQGIGVKLAAEDPAYALYVVDALKHRRDQALSKLKARYGNAERPSAGWGA